MEKREGLRRVEIANTEDGTSIQGAFSTVFTSYYEGEEKISYSEKNVSLVNTESGGFRGDLDTVLGQELATALIDLERVRAENDALKLQLEEANKNAI